MLNVSIVGATGYTGHELIRILLDHPSIQLSALTSRRYQGQPIERVFPALKGCTDLVCETVDFDRLADRSDFVFTALPHKTAMDVVAGFYGRGKRVVDLSADFRFIDHHVYEAWYQPHHFEGLLAKAVYGLPELHREAIRNARLVANPGCYPTGAVLALTPLIKNKVVDLDQIIIDAKSGVSGAGRDPSLANLYGEVNEGLRAYKVLEHRHCPEIEQELTRLAHKPVRVTFVPHLVPMDRGILTTIYVTLNRKEDTESLLAIYSDYYRDEFFVRVCPEGVYPNVLDVRGSNFCDIGLKVSADGRMVVIVSAVDNLVKGASGQAVQNMNLMCGFSEREALTQVALFP
jgi:N-acetyl-gamma-glutamyl-phosphate reductase